MPMYDYKCTSCNHTFEGVYKIDDRDVPTNSPCPVCKSESTIELCIGAPLIGDPIRLGIKKPCGSFTERMTEMKKRLGPKANIQI